MNGSVLVAIAAAFGNLLQGWDSATMAGALFYIRKEFDLQSAPTMEGLIVAMALIGATLITSFSGPLSDSFGRRPVLIISSVLFVISGLVMLWAPNIYILLIARLIDGFASGLIVTIVPVYISETAPSDIRGSLNTLPQFTGSTGMFISYCAVFGMSLMESPNWRLMLGGLAVPSVIYFFMMVMFLPESPRWLVSKGRMVEAKQVLQRLRGSDDVSGEMALLVEGLGVGGDTSIEQYIISPANDLTDELGTQKDQIMIYGADSGLSLIAKPVTGQSTLGFVSRHGSMVNQGSFRVDPMVTLFGSVHENTNDTTNRGSVIFPTWGSMVNMPDQTRSGVWDTEGPYKEGDHHPHPYDGESDDNNLQSPLLSRSGTNAEKDLGVGPSRNPSISQGTASEQVSVMGIGGGWQLAYTSPEEGKEGASIRRIYLHQEGTPSTHHGSIVSLPGGDIQGDGPVYASALVSKSHLRNKDLEMAIGNKMVQPSDNVVKGPSFRDLLEPGVKHALVVGIGLQMLQQFSGISGVMYYTPSILAQAGVGVLLSDLGLRADSASLLLSAFTTLLMLPTIGLAMRLMDVAGRRWLMLSTLPVLLMSLIILVLSTIIPMSDALHAIISTLSVVVYLCIFVMGFGPIPNILCSEIFPTRVRGLCIAICALTFWISDIIVTYLLPVMLSCIGIGGVFGIFAIFCAISWVFVYLKVPETKGMPLEVITEFFAVGAKQNTDDAATKV